MRVLVAAVALVACSGAERAKTTSRVERPVADERVTLQEAAPGLRLPDGVTPLGYDLTLDVDPTSENFFGEVHIRVRLERATDHVWIHAHELAISSARYDGGTLTPLALEGDQMVGFGFGRTVAAGEHELVFVYSGKTTGDQEGLFRQKRGEHWYLFSQAESVFARRITPCFDEPKFKTPWRVTLVVPRMAAALANAAEEKTTAEGRKKRVRFAETPVMPSYLLTIAVGPFDVVDVGTVGANKVPVRVAVRSGAGKQISVVASKLPAIVAAMETYVGEPLPLTKLDLVGVPQFFGAMENPGIITFEEAMLVGKETKQRVEYFTHVAAHEIAHQWFGNSVTPAWWDDLWLSESFASFVGDKITAQLGGFADRPLFRALERREALDADAGPGAIPLRRSIETNADPDEAFDAIAYQKGETVLATFEALVGETTFRDALRDYLKSHRDRSATTFDFIAALTRATKQEIGTAFEQYATQAGVPIVDLSLRCDKKAAVIASARDRRLVPLCITHPGTKAPHCALVGDKVELPLGTACPAWVDGNAASSYYTVHWQDRPATQWLAKLSPSARVIVGDDVAATFRRGELGAKDALAELRTLLAGDLDTQIAGIALAKEIDALVDDATRPAWSRWLAPRLPKLKRGKNPPQVYRLTRELGPMLAGSDRLAAGEQAKARELVDGLLTNDRFPDPPVLGVLSSADAKPFFDRLVEKALATRDSEKREHWLGLLGALPADFAEKTATLVVDKAELPVEPIWFALEGYFERPSARLAAWRALRDHLDGFIKRAPDHADDMLAATGSLCDQQSRDEVAKSFTPFLDRISAGKTRLDRALATIDQCIARRARVGDLAAAIATSR